MTDPTAPDRPSYGVGPVEAFTRFWRRYAVFSGRASRSEYWWNALVQFVLLAVVAVAGAILLSVGASLRGSSDAAAVIMTSLGGVLLFIVVAYSVAGIVPNIAISVRRLHDADLSGWFYLLSFIPSIGGLILLVLHCMPSNRSGRRFDRGGSTWTPAVAPRPVPRPAAVPAPPAPYAGRPIGDLANWPAPEARPDSPVTAQMPVANAQSAEAAEAAGGPRDALRAAWTSVGAVEDLHPKLSSQPSWRRQSYLRVIRPDGIGVLTTQGLSDSEGIAALGPGAEVYLGSTALGDVALERADGWELAVVAGVARRIGASGMNLPSELEEFGALSMNLAVSDAPEGWAAPGGTVGVLLGLRYDGVPETVATPQGEVRLVGMAILHPTELDRIVAGGRAARAEIAARLAQVPIADLVSPERPEV